MSKTRIDVDRLPLAKAQELLDSHSHVQLYTLHPEMTCASCGRIGPFRSKGAWWPDLSFFNASMAPGGNTPFWCPECNNQGMPTGFPRSEQPFLLTAAPSKTWPPPRFAPVYERLDSRCTVCGQRGLAHRYGVFDHEVKQVQADGAREHPFCPHCGAGRND